MLWGVVIAVLASAVAAGIGYATTPIPNPSSFATAQATTLYYSDGKTPFARLGSSTRVDVPLSQVPKAVQHAVLAAEDRHYYGEPGISPTGIIRALITDIRGGEISQGGSTITQQYVKNAYLTSNRTFTRKFKEIFISIKLLKVLERHSYFAASLCRRPRWVVLLKPSARDGGRSSSREDRPKSTRQERHPASLGAPDNAAPARGADAGDGAYDASAHRWR